MTPQALDALRACVGSEQVLVDGDRFAVVADRIHPETILAAERVPEWLKR